MSQGTEQITQQLLAEAIRSATFDVFSTMLGIELTAGEMHIGKTAGGAQSGVVALLGLAGEWSGSGTLSCEAGLACKLAGQLLMAEYDSVNEDVLDAIGELGNMIIGNVKTMLERTLGNMGLSTPTVIYGRNFETHSVGHRDWVIQPFHCGEHRLDVQLTLAPNTSGRTAKIASGFPVEHVVGF